MEYRRNWIYEGMDVADKSQIDVKMTVSRILRQLKRVRRQVGEEVVYEEENQIIGVECLLWQDGKLLTPKFHSRQLVPWVVALEAQDKGYFVIEKFNNLVYEKKQK